MINTHKTNNFDDFIYYRQIKDKKIIFNVKKFLSIQEYIKGKITEGTQKDQDEFFKLINYSKWVQESTRDIQNHDQIEIRLYKQMT